MKRIITAAALTAGLAGTAMAADFQTIGTMGMGGAGVARDMGAYAPHWNPAGLAFAPKTVSTTIGAGLGVRVSDGLADNVDRLSKYTEGSASTFDKLTNLSTITPGSYSAVAADITGLVSVVKDIETQKGALSANADVAVGFQIKNFGTGVFLLSEGYGKIASVDEKNILPANGSASLSLDNVATLVGTQAANTTFFSAAQITTMRNAMNSIGFTDATKQTNIINSLANNLQTPPGANANLPTITAAQATETFANTLVPVFDPLTPSGSIYNNNTAVMVKNVLFTEIPLSYGHALDFGTGGKLGLGATIKAVNARVYQTRIRLIENGESVSSKDIMDGLKDNYEQSTNVTFDLGAQWKYAEWLTVGVVGKNLSSPTFRSPDLKDQKGRLVDANGNLTVTPYHEADIKLKPQARMGIELKPVSWISIAADLDLTENETILQGVNYKNQQLGGGIEFSPASWFKCRAGMYKNLVNSEIGPVATAGLTFGIPWVTLEIDGAYSLDTTTYDNQSYPKEARVQTQLVIQF